MFVEEVSGTAVSSQLQSKLLQEIRGLWLGMVAAGQTMKHFSKLQKDLDFKSLDTQLQKESIQFTGQISFAILVMYFKCHLSYSRVFNFLAGSGSHFPNVPSKCMCFPYVLLGLALFPWTHFSYQSANVMTSQLIKITNIFSKMFSLLSNVHC